MSEEFPIEDLKCLHCGKEHLKVQAVAVKCNCGNYVAAEHFKRVYAEMKEKYPDSY